MSLSDRFRTIAPLRVIFCTQFGGYLFGNTTSLTGTWMQKIACSWLVWDWTHSALWVGILAASDLLPVIAISPFAGVAADRWDRKRVNVIAQCLSALAAILMALLLAIGHLGLPAILILIFIQGALTAATQPSRFAMVQQMVPRADVGPAVGLNSACVNIARMLGPAAAGAMIVHWNILWVFAANAASSVILIGILMRLRLAASGRKDTKASFLAEMREGFAHVLQTPALRLVLLGMFAGGVMVRGVMELLPAVAAQVFGDGVTGLAILTGAAAIGAVASGVTMRARDMGLLLKRVPLWWALGGLSCVALTQATASWVAVAAAMAMGAAVTRALVSSQTFVQLTTADYLRGRALSVFGLVARGSPALGALAIGYGADLMGLGPVVMISSGILIAVLALLAMPISRAAETAQDAP